MRPDVGKAPIVVGGTGGSGTRLVARILEAGGIWMGSDHNYATDARSFIPYYSEYLRGRFNPDSLLLEAVEKHLATIPDLDMPWGWKNPRSHLCMWHINKHFPDVKFVHVIRDGRDLAYSPHASLHTYWSSYLPDWGLDPETKMTLWAMTNMQSASFGEYVMDNYYRLRYEDVCDNPTAFIGGLYGFVGISGSINNAAQIIDPTLSHRGRWKGQPGIERVTEIGKTALERFGYL